MIRGIGPVYATKLVRAFGATVFDLIEQEPARLREVTGIRPKRAARPPDARDPIGRAVLHRLLAGADILVHGYRPGAMDSIGLGAADRAQIRPGLIDVSLDAYGWTGPWAGRRGVDSLLQISSGMADEGMRRFGAASPMPLPVQALDHAAGWIMAAAVLRGLTERRTGHGWTARTSLARVAALLAPTAGDDDLRRSLSKPDQADFEDAPEHTVWGPVRRLRPPLTITGTPLHWDRPACPLGSGKACWAT